MNKLRVALLYNLKYHVQVTPGAPADALAEYDSEETVAAIERSLALGGHEVIRLEADETLPNTVRRAAPDICFNIAEGLRGDARESQVPALLEMWGIPYTASKVLAHAVSLDKAMAKSVWRDSGLPTAPFQVFRRGDEAIGGRLHFPLFVKPVREGSGMGISSRSIVADEAGLRAQVHWVIETYHQPALVEEHLPGREFTVGFIGNTMLPGERRWNDMYNERGFHLFPVVEIDTSVGAVKGIYNTEAKSYNLDDEKAPGYLCPADIPAVLDAELKTLALAAFETIGGLDIGRVDFRLGNDGQPYILEINTLPGLKPSYSDICIMAETGGVPHKVLINEVLHLALERYAREGHPVGVKAFGETTS